MPQPCTHLDRNGPLAGLDLGPEQSPTLPVGMRVGLFCLLLVGGEDPGVAARGSVDVQVELVALLHAEVALEVLELFFVVGDWLVDARVVLNSCSDGW